MVPTFNAHTSTISTPSKSVNQDNILVKQGVLVEWQFLQLLAFDCANPGMLQFAFEDRY
jgi:hypothetical protein